MMLYSVSIPLTVYLLYHGQQPLMFIQFFLFHHLVDGIITSLSCFQSIHRIKKDSSSQLTVDEVVDRIFQAADSDGDGDYLFILILMEVMSRFRTRILFFEP